MQSTSILAMLLAGAALTVAALGGSPPTYNGGSQCPSGYTGEHCTEKSPVGGNNGGSGSHHCPSGYTGADCTEKSPVGGNNGGSGSSPSGYGGNGGTVKSPVGGSGHGSYPGGNGGSGYYPGGNGGSGYYPGGNGGSGYYPGGNGGNGGHGGSGSGDEQPFTCSQSNGLLQGSAQCCQTNILGVASLTCSPIQSNAFTQEEFSESCARNGRVASCCLLPAAGLGLVCQDIGTGEMLN